MDAFIVVHVNGEPRLSGSVAIRDLVIHYVSGDIATPRWVLLNVPKKPDARPGAVQVLFKVTMEQPPTVVTTNTIDTNEPDQHSVNMLANGVALLSVDRTERQLRHEDLPEPLDLDALLSGVTTPAVSAAGPSDSSRSSGTVSPASSAATPDGGQSGRRASDKSKTVGRSKGKKMVAVVSSNSSTILVDVPAYATLDPRSTAGPVTLKKKGATIQPKLRRRVDTSTIDADLSSLAGGASSSARMTSSLSVLGPAGGASSSSVPLLPAPSAPSAPTSAPPHAASPAPAAAAPGQAKA